MAKRENERTNLALLKLVPFQPPITIRVQRNHGDNPFHLFDAVTEQLVSNLLPVSKLLTVVQTARTEMRIKEDIRKFTDRRDVPPFILREGAEFSVLVHETAHELLHRGERRAQTNQVS